MRCPRCGGPLLRGYDRGEYSCLYCGELLLPHAAEAQALQQRELARGPVHVRGWPKGKLRKPLAS
jgi:hypothetical protein